MTTCELVLRTPAQAVAGRPVRVVLLARNASQRVDFEYSGAVEWSSTDDKAQLPDASAVFSCERGRRTFWTSFRRPGMQRLRAHDSDLHLDAESDLISVTEAAADMNLYWGDLHGHSGDYACGRGTIDAYYGFARDYAGLDFCALTDHDHMPKHASDLSTIWERVKRAARYYNDPHHFVTFLGYEWTSMLDQDPDDNQACHGQRHVLYLDDDEPYFSCHKSASASPEKLWACLEGRAALVIVHHSAAPTQWGCPWTAWHPRLERLIEIYSVWGNSERPAAAGNPRPVLHTPGEGKHGHVQEALAKGYRPGFCAGGDSHDGNPGDTGMEHPMDKAERRRWGGWIYHGGLHGVWAKELTRESLWEAMQARRCYGTTGARIRVQFAVNGSPMGSELALPANAPRRLSVHVLGTGPLRSVDVIKSDQDWRSLPCSSNGCDGEVVDSAPVASGDFYYVRVTQADGHMAWSSPVWVDVHPKEQL